ncbi:hypothetical protein ABK040_012972 [Willaertia magna]
MVETKSNQREELSNVHNVKGNVKENIIQGEAKTVHVQEHRERIIKEQPIILQQPVQHVIEEIHVPIHRYIEHEPIVIRETAPTTMMNPQVQRTDLNFVVQPGNVNQNLQAPMNTNMNINNNPNLINTSDVNNNIQTNSNVCNRNNIQTNNVCNNCQ